MHIKQNIQQHVMWLSKPCRDCHGFLFYCDIIICRHQTTSYKELSKTNWYLDDQVCIMYRSSSSCSSGAGSSSSSSSSSGTESRTWISGLYNMWFNCRCWHANPVERPSIFEVARIMMHLCRVGSTINIESSLSSIAVPHPTPLFSPLVVFVVLFHVFEQFFPGADQPLMYPATETPDGEAH